MRVKCFYVLVPLLSVSLALFSGGPALAHTGVLSSQPEDGATLERTPGQVVLELDGPVEAQFSPLEVYDEGGERVDLDDARLDPDDPTVLMVGLREGLSGGEYSVEYRYAGVDGHPIEGSYGFSVSNASAAPDGARTDAEVTGSQGEQAPEERLSDTGGYSSALIYGALGLGALALMGLLVLRRR
ncbi:MAG: copper resistance protein CopC [Rubrobacter sp.]|jgi:methionine-rich copper-binding protein CopC|nr:copper resistance protein CopC [Rubrobacter sp.]